MQIVVKKREPLNYLVPDGSAGFSSRLAASQDMMTFSPPSVRSEFHHIDRVTKFVFFNKKKYLNCSVTTDIDGHPLFLSYTDIIGS